MANESSIEFNITGPALSFLYYECDKSRMDQVGFLIGEKHTYIKKSISDSEVKKEEAQTVYNITASITIGLPFHFCDNIGRVDKAKLKELLGPLEKNVCGWYIFRRNSSLNPLLRGTLIHRELLQCLPHVSPESFTLCCIGSELVQSRATHRYRHVFLVYINRTFLPISVSITNLSQTLNSHYRTLSMSSKSSVNEIVNSLKLDDNADGLTIMKSLQKPLQDKITEMALKIQQYDEMAQKLENEVHEMKFGKYKHLLKEEEEKEDTHDNSRRKSQSGASGDEAVGEEDEKDGSLLLDKMDEEKEMTAVDNSEEIVESSQKEDDTLTAIGIPSDERNDRRSLVYESEEY